MSLPGLALVTSFIFSQCEIGDDFNICLYLALPLSLTPFILSQGEKGVILTYVSTWLCLCHSIHLMARSEKGGVLTYVSTWPCPCHSTDLCAR